MMTARSASTGAARRAAAVLALLCLVLNVLYLAIATMSRWTVLLTTVASMSVAIIACWYAVSRRGVIRWLAVVVALAALATFVVVLVRSDSVRVLVAGLVLAGVSIIAAGYALRPAAPRARLTSAATAQQPVLLMNPKSGGGKAERFQLADRCRQAGVEPIVLRPGDDLRQLAESAVAGGADLIGMAGGDGSQALVASVASAHGIPFVVIPAGTRNHFALDLGIDREDVAGALDAYRDGVDVTVDLAEVNGTVFVNNAAMGVYAKIVQSEGYREAKIQTTAAVLPELLGPEAGSADLHLTLPSGEELEADQLLLISNNRYRLEHLRGGGRRSRLDAGVLGVASLTVTGPADIHALAALELAGRIGEFRGLHEWTTAEVEVRSPRPVEIGIDGEAVTIDPPLRFVSRPRALTVRLPRSAAGQATPQPVRVTDRTMIVALWRVAFGRNGGSRHVA